MRDRFHWLYVASLVGLALTIGVACSKGGAPVPRALALADDGTTIDEHDDEPDEEPAPTAPEALEGFDDDGEPLPVEPEEPDEADEDEPEADDELDEAAPGEPVLDAAAPAPSDLVTAAAGEPFLARVTAAFEAGAPGDAAALFAGDRGYCRAWHFASDGEGQAPRAALQCAEGAALAALADRRVLGELADDEVPTLTCADGECVRLSEYAEARVALALVAGQPRIVGTFTGDPPGEDRDDAGHAAALAAWRVAVAARSPHP